MPHRKQLAWATSHVQSERAENKEWGLGSDGRGRSGEQVGRPYRCLAMVSLVAFPRDKKMTLSSLAERRRSKTQKSRAASGAAAENRDRDSSTKSNVRKSNISLLICPLEATEVGLCQNMTISVWSSHLWINFQLP